MRPCFRFPIFILLSFFAVSVHAQWTQVTSGTNATLYAVDMVNADTAYAAGVGVFLKSTNGGQSWTSVPIVNNANQPINGLTIHDMHFFNGMTGVAVGNRSGIIHTILRTIDGGAHWSTVLTQNDPGNWDGGIWQVDFINAGQGWCVGSSGKVRRTLDGGQTWTELPSITSLTYLYSVDFADAQVGYASGAFSFGGGQFLKTMDGGQTWNPISSDVFYDLDFVSPDTGFMAGQFYFFRKTDNTPNWDFLTIPDEQPVRKCMFQNGNEGYVLTEKGVRRTETGGQFWIDYAFPNNNQAQMYDFDWAPGFQKGIAVGNVGRLFRTTNGGGAGAPMAFFTTNPQQAYYCKDQVITLANPAPAGEWNSTWWVDDMVYSTANDITVSFSDYGATHTVKLLISNGITSDTFQRTLQTEQALEFPFGEVVWNTGAQMCQGGNAYVTINNPSLNRTYYFSLNNEVISQQLALNSNPITFQTPFLNADADLCVFVNEVSFCGTYFHAEDLHVTVFPFPNPNLNWTMPDYVCVNGSAPITIYNSEPGIRYWLEESNIFTRSDTLLGNGGTLTFISDPLNQSVNYQVRAANAIGCMNWIGQPIQVNIDQFYLMVDTTHLYGVEGYPIQVSNFTENLGASNWNFGAAAQPASSQAPTPVVTYSNTGTYPYLYQYQSLNACQGNLAGQFEIFEQALDLNGASCWSQRLLNAVYVNDHIMDVKVDAQGNYWVTGASFQPVGFWLTMNLFLNKYDASGVLLWSKKVNPEDPANSFDYRNTYGLSIAFDGSGNAYLSGSYSADNARIFGIDFTRPTSFFASYPQGFLLKLDADGNVIWHNSFQAINDYESCIPTSIVFHENRLHLMLKGGAWQMFQSDGNLATNAAPDAAAWYIALDENGNFIQDLPLKESFLNAVTGSWLPELVSFSTELVTFRSPRLLLAANGKLLVNGVFTGLANLDFGGVTIAPLDATFSAKNQFVAVLDPTSGQCEQAFCALSQQTPQSDFPAWQTDATGDVYFGFGATNTYPTYTPSIKIGQNVNATPPNRSYTAKFSQNGDLLWYQQHTDIWFNSFAKSDDGIWALSRFDQSVGMRSVGSNLSGVVSNGGNDLLLSHIDAEGNVTGMQHFGGSAHEQAVALVNAGATLLGIFSADDLNQYLNAPPNAYTLRVWSSDPAECPVLSTDETLETLTWEVQPNPFSDLLVCTFHIKEATSDAICRLLSTDGRIVWSKNIGRLREGDTTLELETASLPAGVYLLEITAAEGAAVRKVIKWK